MEKTLVITGGTGGLGTALVRRLVYEDYRLAVTYLMPEEAEQFEQEFDLDEDRRRDHEGFACALDQGPTGDVVLV